jgi:hypothetical protein
VLIPPPLLPAAAARVLAANSAFIIECDRVWSLKQLGAIGRYQAEVLFARASYAHDQAAGPPPRPVMSGLALSQEMAAAEATLDRERARLREAMRAGHLGTPEFGALLARAYRQRDARLHELLDIPDRYECRECGATGYDAPHHRPGCGLAAGQERLVLPRA